MCLKQGRGLFESGLVFFVYFSEQSLARRPALMWLLHSLSLTGRSVKVHLPCRASHPHLGLTRTALLAPPSCLQKPIAATRLLRTDRGGGKQTCFAVKGTNGSLEPSRLHCAFHSYKCKFLLPPFSGRGEGAKGGPWLENMPLTIPSC